MPGQRSRSWATVSMTVPTSTVRARARPVRDPQTSRTLDRRTHSGRRQPRILARPEFVLVSSVRLGLERRAVKPLPDTSPAMIRNMGGTILAVSVRPTRIPTGQRHRLASSQRRPPEPCACPIRARSKGQTRALTVIRGTSAMTMTCIGAGLARHSRSLPSPWCPCVTPVLAGKSVVAAAR
jgi:hypothetical protein